MILIKCPTVNGITQKIYDKIINRCDLTQMKCPHCHHTGMITHAYYDRRVINKDKSFRLVVKRAKCLFCEKTHALLLINLVPYSSVTMEDTINIISADTPEEVEEILNNNLNIDISYIYRIKSNYRKYWKERLLSFELRNDDKDICKKCIKLFKRQYMQIHWTAICGYG